MNSHPLAAFLFFKLIVVWRPTDAQSISWTGSTIFDNVTPNNNTWTTGLPQLKVEFSSNLFNLSGIGYFDFNYNSRDGTRIKICQFFVQPSVCTKNCGVDDTFSCTGQPSSGLLVTMNITNLSDDLDGSFAILSQGSPPMTTDEWNIDPLIIGVQNCTEAGDINPSTNFDQPVSCNYLCSTPLECVKGYYDSSGYIEAICQANNTWKQNGTCVPGDKDIIICPGDLAGIVLTCIVVVTAIIVAVITLKLYPMTKPLKIAYGVAFGVCVVGILMSFLGSDECYELNELNDVEITGIVLASLGTAAAVGALVYQVVQGSNGKS